jgi:hypothetical protein
MSIQIPNDMSLPEGEIPERFGQMIVISGGSGQVIQEGII